MRDIQKFLSKVKDAYELGDVVYGPGEFLFFGLQVIQQSDLSITIYEDEKLNSVPFFPISLNQRKMVDEILNKVELRSFRFVNSSFGWYGT